MQRCDVRCYTVFVYCHSKYSVMARFLLRAHDHNMTNGDFAIFTFRAIRFTGTDRPWTFYAKDPEDYPRLKRAFYVVKQVRDITLGPGGLLLQKAQLSHRSRAMLCISWLRAAFVYSASTVDTVRSILSNRIRRSLDDDSVATLVHAFVASRVDYCDSLLIGAPRKTTDKIATCPQLGSTKRLEHAQVRPGTHSFSAKSATLAGCCRPNSVQSLRPGVQMSAQDGS